MDELAGFPVFADETDFETAQAVLTEAELADGLPLVVPTRRRLDAMLADRADAEQVLGHLLPLFGELRADAVAYQCVIAGCRPAELPVVLAASQACLEEEFNLLGLLTTTGTPAVAVLVHGPAAGQLEMNAATNCLGPGNRANACIGRALSLVLRNIAGARPGVGDMATMGQPGKYGFCFAEGAHAGLPSLAARRGMDAGQSAVTILGVSGSAEVLPLAGAGDATDILRPIALAMGAAIAVSGAGRERDVSEQYVLLPPEMVDRLQADDWPLARIQSYLFEHASVCQVPGDGNPADGAGEPVARTPEDIHPIVTGGAGVKMTYLPPWSGGTRSVTRPT